MDTTLLILKLKSSSYNITEAAYYTNDNFKKYLFYLNYIDILIIFTGYTYIRSLLLLFPLFFYAGKSENLFDQSDKVFFAV